MKKNRIGFVVLVGLALPLAAFAQNAGKEFTVTGTVQHAKPGSKAYLETNEKVSKRLDSTQIDANGSFALKGNEINGGSFYKLNLANEQFASLLVEGGENLAVTADLNDKNKLRIKGSVNMEYYPKIVAIDAMMQKKSKEWQKQAAEAAQKNDLKKGEAIDREVMATNKQVIDTIKAMIPQMGTSSVAMIALKYLDPKEHFPLYESLAEQMQKAKLTGKQAQAFINFVTMAKSEMAAQATQVAVVEGALAPDVTLEDAKGQVISLSSLRGKYVLIDFWASWCKPCREENPNVVRMYNKYKEKGFEVFSISLDDNKNAWLKAIENDGMIWTNVLGKKNGSSAVAQQYSIQVIPTTFLLDKDGKIIARNLRGPALEQKLESILDK
ncbi:TlpA disulfide reductase family protein [Larkinella knui]|uniref:AhpC/TSA family protein n=1 Tax=Larkinella knui TaxID=2025310 RepID=A0A3P1CCP9_9BACT|nr:TlpA disulfide reductase family protein [Larkinella knui]RRB11052.1 AhpC/TSA family protein [Larkinella knui]